MRFNRGCLLVSRKLRFYFFPALMALAVVAFLACEKKTETELPQSESFLIDSVLSSSFSLLDSVAYHLYIGTDIDFPLVRLQEAVATMEGITGIYVKHGSDIGILDINSVELSQWRDWIKKNRDRLKWDTVSQSITVEELPQDLL